MPMTRAAYVRALRAERAAIASRREPDAVRLAALDAELEQFEDAPAVRVVEAAVPGDVPGPFSSRARAAAKRGTAEPKADADR